MSATDTQPYPLPRPHYACQWLSNKQKYEKLFAESNRKLFDGLLLLIWALRQHLIKYYPMFDA